jgi:prolipoprotein diacylglyceryltransferase
MLRSMLEYAKLSASTLAGRIVGGAIVVVPFIIAALFGLAAIYMVLRNSYGDVMAAVILAVAFAVIGLVAAIIVVARTRQQEKHLEELRAEARQSAITSALLAVNPALILGAARVGYGLFRRAPVLTAVAPLAAGFLLAMASANQRRRAREAATTPASPGRAREHQARSGNSRELIH